MSESQKTAVSQDVKMEVEKNRNRAALRRTFFGRVIRSVVVAFWVMVIAFSLIRLSPGDPVRMALGADVTEEAVEEFRTQLGLDKGVLTQFWDYFSGILRGDLGYSYFSGRNVTEIVGTHLPVTLMIIGLSIGFAAIISIPLALYVAMSKSNTVNYLFRALTSISLAVPGFFLALMGLLVFGVYFNIAPAAGYEGAFPANLKFLDCGHSRRRICRNRRYSWSAKRKVLLVLLTSPLIGANCRSLELHGWRHDWRHSHHGDHLLAPWNRSGAHYSC